MRWNRHSRLHGEHAFLSPSQYHWINYTQARLLERWTATQASIYGTAQHEYAVREIRAGRKSKLVGTIGQFINDAIEFGMNCEQVLFYSENCFGTADAISFKRKRLRIHDLKTGLIPGSIHQLEIYSAIFCLEYEIDPRDIRIELRIYQSDEVGIFDADPEDILEIMDKIQEFDKIIAYRKLEEEL